MLKNKLNQTLFRLLLAIFLIFSFFLNLQAQIFQTRVGNTDTTVVFYQGIPITNNHIIAIGYTNPNIFSNYICEIDQYGAVVNSKIFNIDGSYSFRAVSETWSNGYVFLSNKNSTAQNEGIVLIETDLTFNSKRKVLITAQNEGRLNGLKIIKTLDPLDPINPYGYAIAGSYVNNQSQTYPVFIKLNEDLTVNQPLTRYFPLSCNYSSFHSLIQVQENGSNFYYLIGRTASAMFLTKLDEGANNLWQKTIIQGSQLIGEDIIQNLNSTDITISGAIFENFLSKSFLINFTSDGLLSWAKKSNSNNNIDAHSVSIFKNFTGGFVIGYNYSEGVSNSQAVCQFDNSGNLNYSTHLDFYVNTTFDIFELSDNSSIVTVGNIYNSSVNNGFVAKYTSDLYTCNAIPGDQFISTEPNIATPNVNELLYVQTSDISIDSSNFNSYQLLCYEEQSLIMPIENETTSILLNNQSDINANNKIFIYSVNGDLLTEINDLMLGADLNVFLSNNNFKTGVYFAQYFDLNTNKMIFKKILLIN